MVTIEQVEKEIWNKNQKQQERNSTGKDGDSSPSGLWSMLRKQHQGLKKEEALSAEMRRVTQLQVDK